MWSLSRRTSGLRAFCGRSHQPIGIGGEVEGCVADAAQGWAAWPVMPEQRKRLSVESSVALVIGK